MLRPAHHAALAAANGKIYVCGGFVAPEKAPVPVGAAWQPIDDVWEYDPAGDSWKALAPLPTKTGAAVAVEVRGKIYFIGGVTTVEGSKGPFFTFMGPCNVLFQLRVRSGHGQVGTVHADGGPAQPCGGRGR